MIAKPGIRTLDDTAPSSASVARLVLVAASAAAVQAFLLDELGGVVVRHLDLPLTVAAVLVAAHPTRSTVIGLVIGLAVDATGHRLFGLHGLAYVLLGPVTHRVSGGLAPRWRRSPAARTIPQLARRPMWSVSVPAAVATGVVVAGQALAAGAPAPDWPARMIVTPLWVVALAGPLGLVVPLLDGQRSRIRAQPRPNRFGP